MAGVIQGLTDENDHQPVRVSEGRLKVTGDVGAPVPVMAPPGLPLTVTTDGSYPLHTQGIADGNAGGYTKAIAATSSSMQLPEVNGEYLLIATGNQAYCKQGGSTVTAATGAGNFDFPAPEGSPLRLRLSGPYLAWIGDSAAGTISIVHLKRV